MLHFTDNYLLPIRVYFKKLYEFNYLIALFSPACLIYAEFISFTIISPMKPKTFFQDCMRVLIEQYQSFDIRHGNEFGKFKGLNISSTGPICRMHA